MLTLIKLSLNFIFICCVKSVSQDSNGNISEENDSLTKELSCRKHSNENEILNSGSLEDIRKIMPANSTMEDSDRDYQDSIDTESEESQTTLIDYSYSVSVQRKGAHYASGALVGRRWILTTATEFYNGRETIKLFRARLGSVDCKRGGTLVPIIAIEIHPRFTPGSPSFDISMLRMAHPVGVSDTIHPIVLSRVEGKVISAKFLITYWPRIVVKDKVLPPTAKERIKYNSMRASTQRLIPTEQCSAFLASVNQTLGSNSLCLKPITAHHSICMPDVGAPVTAEGGLWGITSGWVSPSCPTKPGPTIFTRISAKDVQHWINKQLVLN